MDSTPGQAFTSGRTDKFIETEDTIFFEATITGDLSEAQVYDVFMLRDGKATHHFSGIISPRTSS